jgi:hypothetical protein
MIARTEGDEDRLETALLSLSGAIHCLSIAARGVHDGDKDAAEAVSYLADQLRQHYEDAREAAFSALSRLKERAAA